MTDDTVKSFAYRLFHAIRSNKKALLAARPTPAMFADNRAQCRKLELLIHALFVFEKYARGNQTALAGIDLPKHFTSKAGRSLLSSAYHQWFLQNVNRHANQIVKRMLYCQNLLVGPLWQKILSIEGLPRADFQVITQEYIRYDQLPDLVNTFRWFSAKLEDTNFLTMEFKNGEVTRTRSVHFPLPIVEGNSLEEQLVQLSLYWQELKHFARNSALDPANWPSQASVEQTELQNVKGLWTQFYFNLRPEQKALVQKYSAEMKNFIIDAM